MENYSLKKPVLSSIVLGHKGEILAMNEAFYGSGWHDA